MSQSNFASIPGHVPPELVFDFDIWNMPAEFSHPIDYYKSIEARGAPPIFYTPHHGGHWVLYKFQDTLEGFRATELSRPLLKGYRRGREG